MNCKSCARHKYSFRKDVDYCIIAGLKIPVEGVSVEQCRESYEEKKK